MRRKSGFSVFEIVFVLGAIGFLTFVAPALYKRLLGKRAQTSDGKTVVRVPTALPAPWTAFSQLPTPVNGIQNELSHWMRRVKETNQPVLGDAERNSVKAKIHAHFASSVTPVPGLPKPTGQYVSWGVYADSQGNAILAGGMLVGFRQYPYFFLRNDGSVKILNAVKITSGPQGDSVALPPEQFVPIYNWHWHRHEGTTHLIQVGVMRKDEKERFDFDASKLVVYFDGEPASGELHFETTKMPIGSGLAMKDTTGRNKTLVGNILDPHKKTYSLASFWSKNDFEQKEMRYTLDGYLLSDLNFAE